MIKITSEDKSIICEFKLPLLFCSRGAVGCACCLAFSSDILVTSSAKCELSNEFYSYFLLQHRGEGRRLLAPRFFLGAARVRLNFVSTERKLRCLQAGQRANTQNQFCFLTVVPTFITTIIKSRTDFSKFLDFYIEKIIRIVQDRKFKCIKTCAIGRDTYNF